MASRKLTAIGAAAAAGALTLAMAQQAGASDSADAAPGKGVTMMGAMERDLGLSAAQAKDRLAAETSAGKAAKTLKGELGQDFAGAWFDAQQNTLVVGVTDAAQASAVRAAGAQPKTVTFSAAQLDGYVAKLDKASAPSSVTSFHTDVTSNTVVVKTLGSTSAAKSFATKAGVPASAVVVEEAPDRPQPLDVVGGNAYYIGTGARCSVGFSVDGGFVTAGHCGSAGDSTSQPTGSFAGSSFPGNDYAFVETGDTPVGAVNDYAGGTVAVAGSSEAPVGSSICRSGSTTGWHCGTIDARGATVNYAEGSVSGLIQTDVCAEPGDSGGSAISGSQAQGVTSGGSGDCTFGGETFFQPVNEILGAYGLSLVTS